MANRVLRAKLHVGCVLAIAFASAFPLAATPWGIRAAPRLQQDAGSAWRDVHIMVASDVTYVRTDGKRCETSNGVFRISPGSVVRLAVDGLEETFTASLSDSPLEPDPAGLQAPGARCDLWATFHNVPIADGYQIDIAPAAGSDVGTAKSQAGVGMLAWTDEFTAGELVDGKQMCETHAATVALPAMGSLLDGACLTNAFSMFSSSPPYHVVLGTMSSSVAQPPPAAASEATNPAPIRAPAALRGIVERRISVPPGDPSMIEALSFVVIAHDPRPDTNSNPDEFLDAISLANDAVDDSFRQAMSSPSTTDSELIRAERLGDMSIFAMEDAPGDAMDYGMISVARGSLLCIVRIAGHGSATPQQLYDIAAEWIAEGGAGEHDWTPPDVGINGPNTYGLFAFLPLPGQLNTLPDGARFDGDWLVAVGE